MSQKTRHIINCLHCREKNSLGAKKLINLNSMPYCKSCQQPLLPYFDQTLDDLSPDAFVHHLDQQMLAALRRLPGIDSVLGALLRHSFELSMRLHHQGNFVQASKKQTKKLYQTLEYAASCLDIPHIPELYLVQDPRVNAYTFGVEKCSVAITTGCLELMTEEEILCVLAHELGHIKARHVLYKTATRILTSLAESIAQKTFGLGSLVLYPLQVALLRWDRASELSSDRAALLVVKKPGLVITTLMKMAGGCKTVADQLSIDAFIGQAKNYEKTQDEGPLGKYIGIMNSVFSTHPFPIWRAREILDWLNDGGYIQILQGKYQRQSESTTLCPICQNELEKDTSHCQQCGKASKKDPDYKQTLDRTVDSIKGWYARNFDLKDGR